ncbi:MAG: hypothetical protein K2P99_00445, partial [Burkholderiales bacterium]|nr:hypothetical protein [Burkholderiales bacterium]
RQQENSEKVIIYPIVGLLSLFVLFQCVNGIGYVKYDAGYNIALLLNQINDIEVIGYKMDDVPQKGLDFYSKNSYISVDNLDIIKNNGKPIYLVSKYEYLQQIMNKYPKGLVYKNISGCEIGIYLENLFDLNKLKLTHFIIIKLN